MTFKKKMSKRTDSKRVECPGLSSEKVDEIRQSFYKHISDLDIPDEERNGEISFDVFLDAINNKLDDKESKEGIRRIFDLFIGDPNADTITLNSLKKISKELGENISDEELNIMLERASKNGVELTFYTK